MTSATYNEIRIVIGSWGSYNAGNARAMGSKPITLSDYDDWKEIEEELAKQGYNSLEILQSRFIFERCTQVFIIDRKSKTTKRKDFFK